MIKVKRVAKSFATLGTLAYAIGGVLVLVSLVPLSKDDLAGALLCALLGVIFIATGLVQMHEERFHKKNQ